MVDFRAWQNVYMEKLVTLQLIGIIVLKSKETRVVTYTCRYSSGYLIPIIQSCQDELRVKCLLEYLQVYRWSPLFPFIIMIPIDSKIANVSLYLFVYFFYN